MSIKITKKIIFYSNSASLQKKSYLDGDLDGAMLVCQARMLGPCLHQAKSSYLKVLTKGPQEELNQGLWQEIYRTIKIEEKFGKD